MFKKIASALTTESLFHHIQRKNHIIQISDLSKKPITLRNTSNKENLMQMVERLDKQPCKQIPFTRQSNKMAFMKTLKLLHDIGGDNSI